MLQWLDDLDDLYGAAGLCLEKLRHLAVALLRALMLMSVGTGGVLLALEEPPLGLATAILLFVLLLYRAVTQAAFMPSPRQTAALN